MYIQGILFPYSSKEKINIYIASNGSNKRIFIFHQKSLYLKNNYGRKINVLLRKGKININIDNYIKK